MPVRILLISSVVPRNTTGGELILYRHLCQPELVLSKVEGAPFKLAIATDVSLSSAEVAGVEEVIQISTPRSLLRLSKTRLARWVQDLRQSFAGLYDSRPLRRYLKQYPPDLIVTVAHGELCWLAQRMAAKFNIPLVTFFHDWWPDLAYVHDWIRPLLTRQFQQLYRQSQLALCVSEAMRQALGHHTNAEVLLPIPQSLQALDPSVLESLEPFDVSSPKRITAVYAGNLSNIYGPVVQALAIASLSNSDLQLKLFGPHPDWPAEWVQSLQAQGIYGGFLSRKQLMQALYAADILLVMMSFSADDRQRMQTSFPSKLLDYCQFGKPILIWGPEHSSAVRWAQQYQIAQVVTSPNPQDMVQAIATLAQQPKMRRQLGQMAWKMATSLFNPATIQQQFVKSLYHTATTQRQDKVYGEQSSISSTTQICK